MGKIFIIYMNKTFKYNNKYRTVADLGKGAYGQINLCQVANPKYEKDIKSYTKEELIQKTFVAVKSIPMEDREKGMDISAMREITMLKELNHPNIIKMHDVFTEERSTFVVLEYMTCDLAKLIERKDIQLKESEIKFIFHQILTGTKHLHDNWILHRDIKPPNILISIDGTLRIIDFGLAKYYGIPNKPMTGGIVTRWYRPPEILLGSMFYGPAVDIWSCGCILAEMFLGEPIFPGQSDIDQ